MNLRMTQAIVAMASIVVFAFSNSILVAQNQGSTNSTQDRVPPRQSSDPYFKGNSSLGSSNLLQPRKTGNDSTANSAPQKNAPSQFSPGGNSLQPKFNPDAKASTPKTPNRVNSDFRPLQPKTLQPKANSKAPFGSEFNASKQPKRIDPNGLANSGAGSGGQFNPGQLNTGQFGTINSPSQNQKGLETGPVNQIAQNPNPNRRTSYESIEPDSISSDANLLGKREFVKVAPAKPGEFFDAGETLAVVGGEPIFAADLMLEANQLIEKFMAGAPDEIKQKQRKEILPKLLKKYVESKLIYVDIVRGLPEPQALQQINKTLGDHFDKEMLPKIVEKNKMKSAAEFDMQLRGQGASLRQFRQKFIEDEFVRYFLKEKIEFDPDVNHQEMLDYYHANSENYRVKERANWEQLVITFAQVPDRKKARAAIAKLGNEVVYGAKFEAVAKKGSQGLKAQEGGQQGWVNKGSLVSTELDKQIFSIPMNRLSDIIETPIGFHIIRVKERSQAGLKPFREAQVEIKARLKEKKRGEVFAKHLEKLRREIPVEILIEGVDLDSKPTGKK